MLSAEPLLRLTNLTRRFDSPDGAAPITILEGVSLELGSAGSLAIIGPSGSGKSTLLHIIGTLDRASSGEITLAGRDLSRLDEKELAEVRNRQIGFVFQFHYLLPQCSVLENVLVPTLAQKKRAGSQGLESPVARAKHLLTRVGLSERLSHRPGQLSGGERQRVAVVRALINRPHLLLADEPTGALDQASASELAQLLTELNREEGVAMIVVTHARDLAGRMGRVLELKSGRLVPSQPKV
jgi:predicted ABC-type transport system involved in lysophospholipase L1 biosynthesis ATPase subunit